MLISGIQPFSLLDYPGKVSCIVFTPGCNFRCGYCHNPEFVLPDKVAALRDSFVDESAFFNFLNKRDGKLDAVVVSGGEPTLMPDLVPFIQKIREKGLFVKLDSNGNRPSILSELLEKKLVDYIAMDFKTSLSDYKNLVGPWVVEKNIEESINILKNSKIDHEFRTTLVREIHTPEVLLEMGNQIKGANKLYLQTFRPGVTLSPSFGTNTPFSEEETNEIANLFRSFVNEVYIRK